MRLYHKDNRTFLLLRYTFWPYKSLLQKNSVENKIEIESDVIKSIKFKVLSHLLKDFQNIDPKELEVYIYNERKHISDSIYYAEIAALSSLNNNQIPFPQHKDIHKNISPFYIKVGHNLT